MADHQPVEHGADLGAGRIWWCESSTWLLVFGARVAVAEDRYMGRTCVNVGCVPEKLYVYAAEFGKSFKDARSFGWNSEQPAFNWATLRDNKKIEISRLNAIYDVTLWRE